MAGQGLSVNLEITLLPNFSLNQFLTMTVVWQVAPSCWKDSCLLVATFLTLGQSTVCNISR